MLDVFSDFGPEHVLRLKITGASRQQVRENFVANEEAEMLIKLILWYLDEKLPSLLEPGYNYLGLCERSSYGSNTGTEQCLCSNRIYEMLQVWSEAEGHCVTLLNFRLTICSCF